MCCVEFVWSSQGGMGVCRHDQNEESSRDRGGAQTQQGKTNSAKNTQAENPLGFNNIKIAS